MVFYFVQSIDKKNQWNKFCIISSHQKAPYIFTSKNIIQDTYYILYRCLFTLYIHIDKKIRGKNKPVYYFFTSKNSIKFTSKNLLLFKIHAINTGLSLCTINNQKEIYVENIQYIIYWIKVILIFLHLKNFINFPPRSLPFKLHCTT